MKHSGCLVGMGFTLFDASHQPIQSSNKSLYLLFSPMYSYNDATRPVWQQASPVATAVTVQVVAVLGCLLLASPKLKLDITAPSGCIRAHTRPHLGLDAVAVSACIWMPTS